jgi:glycosyltransferase involved in cell wall biosynthesis
MPAKKPKISIVLPTFHEEKYLPACLSSIASCDFPKKDLEIIIINSCSSDKTREIAKNFGAKVLLLRERGIVLARQKGTLAASGKIIISADADCVYPSDWLKRIMSHFSNPKVVGVAGWYKWRTESIPLKITAAVIKFFLILGYFLFGRAFNMTAQNFAFRKEAFLAIGGYNLKIPFVGDELDFLFRLERHGKVVFDPKILIRSSTRFFVDKGSLFTIFFKELLFKVVPNYFSMLLLGKILVNPKTYHAEREELSPTIFPAIQNLNLQRGKSASLLVKKLSRTLNEKA